MEKKFDSYKKLYFLDPFCNLRYMHICEKESGTDSQILFILFYEPPLRWSVTSQPDSEECISLIKSEFF